MWCLMWHSAFMWHASCGHLEFDISNTADSRWHIRRMPKTHWMPSFFFFYITKQRRRWDINASIRSILVRKTQFMWKQSIATAVVCNHSAAVLKWIKSNGWTSSEACAHCFNFVVHYHDYYIVIFHRFVDCVAHCWRLPCPFITRS